MNIQDMISTMDIHLLAVGERKLTSDWNYRNVSSFFNRIYYICEGSTTVRHHNETFELKTGDLHLIPCHTPADYICTGPDFKVRYLHFTSRMIGGIDLCTVREYPYTRPARSIDILLLKQLTDQNPGRDFPVIDPSNDRYRLYHNSTNEHYHDLPAALHLENTGCMSIMLAPFFSTVDFAQNANSENGRLNAFVDYVEQNLNSPMDLTEIADHLSLTPNYLSDWLFQMIRMRPVEYINLRKIEMARHWLETSDLSIKEISYQLGYTSPTYFARVFKKTVGISASDYRKDSSRIPVQI